VFGYANDRLGRKRLFSFTLPLYLSATAATAFSWNFTSFVFFHALTVMIFAAKYTGAKPTAGAESHCF
jgi:MFS family permease